MRYDNKETKKANKVNPPRASDISRDNNQSVRRIQYFERTFLSIYIYIYNYRLSVSYRMSNLEWSAKNAGFELSPLSIPRARFIIITRNDSDTGGWKLWSIIGSNGADKSVARMPAYNGRTIVLRRSWHIGLANAGYSVAWRDRCDFARKPRHRLSLSLPLSVSDYFPAETGINRKGGGEVNDLSLILSIIR